MNDDLCVKCRRVLRRLKTGDGTFAGFGTSLELMSSAQKGCHLCTILMHQLHSSKSKPALQLDFKAPIPLLVKRTCYIDTGISFQLFNRDRPEQPQLTDIDFYLDGPKPGMCVLNSRNLGSKETRHRILEWLQNCQANHKDCTKLRPQRHYPKRLISVSPTGEIHLSDTSSWIQRESYAALSHCWGGQSSLMLTENSLNQYMKLIPSEKLPKTFRESIDITIQLGLHYIWIDSLCIIQDSTSDWQEESVKMLSIYRGSFMTIAAAAAPNANGGLFADRNPLSVVPCTVNTEINQQILQFTSDYKNHNELADLPLASRAWVLQEKLISPRVLSFAANEVFWECCSILASETFPAGILTGERAELYQFNLYRRLRSYMHDALPGNKPVLWRVWNELIEEYSTKRLTRTTDKLVAIDGLVKIFEEAWSDQKPSYLAGLWSRWLPQGLLWASTKPRDSSRPFIARVPSWSWASVDGPVQFYKGSLGHGKGLVKILDASTEAWNDGSLQSSVIRGHIRVSGLLRSFTVNLKGPKKDNCYEMSIFTKDQFGDADEFGPSEVTARIDFDQSEFCTINGGCFFLMPFELEEHSESSITLRGLVLRRVYQCKGTYARIGYFSMDDRLTPRSSEPPPAATQKTSPLPSSNNSKSQDEDSEPDSENADINKEDFKSRITYVDIAAFWKDPANDDFLSARQDEDAILEGKTHKNDLDTWDPNDPFDTRPMEVDAIINKYKALGFHSFTMFLVSFFIFKDYEFFENDDYEECPPGRNVVISIV